MTTQNWRRVEEIFDRVAATSPAGRAAVLDEACGGDATLRAEVESLLEHDTRASEDFLASPVASLRPDGGTSPAWAQQLVGQKVGRYTIVRLIGHGGMGCVFEAMQDQPARAVALKVLQPGLAASSALARLRLEPEVLGRLQHPHIAQVFEAGVHEDDHDLLPYFAMELIPDAQPLTAYADAHELTTRQRLELFAKVCDAVQHGHQKGIIHRDLKPANILVGQDGEPRVIDFGVARSTDADIMLTTQCTRVGDLVGTVHYMSPEQCDGDSSAIDTRSDIYSLGVVLYELLTGVAPYDTSGTTLYSAVRTIKEELPRRPGEISRRFRGDIEAILLKALEKDPARRYESAGALAKDLRAFLAGDPVSAYVPSRAYRIGRYVQRRPWQAGLFASLVLVLLFAAATVLVWNARNAAVEAHAIAEISSYSGKLSAADAAIGINDPATARALLDQAKTDSPDVCGWEWRHLNSRIDESVWNPSAQDDDLLLRDATDVAVSPDGKWIAVVRPNGTLEIINPNEESSSTLLDAALLTRQANEVAWSYDSALLAVTSTDGINENHRSIMGLSVWRTDDLRPRPSDAHWPIDEGCKGTLAFHPSRRLLATDGRDGERGLIKLWNLEHFDESVQDGESVRPEVVLGLGYSHECLAWSRDGDLLASVTAENSEIQVWDFSGAPQVLPAAPITTLRGHTYHILDLAFNPRHPRILASAALDGTVRLWDLRDIRAAADPDPPVAPQSIAAFDILRGHGRGATSVCFDPWGRRLFVGDLHRTLHVWDVEQIRERLTRTPRHTRVNALRGHETRINRICALPDGRVTSVSSDGALKMWAPDAEDVPLLRGHTSSLCAAAFSPDGRTLFTLGGNARLYEWDLATCTPRRWWSLGKAAYDMRLWTNSSDLGVVLACAPDSKQAEITFATLADDGSLDATQRFSGSREDTFKRLALASNQRRLIAGGKDPHLHVWACDGQDEWREMQVLDCEGISVRDIVAVDYNARWAAICVELRDSDALNLSLQVWDLDSGQRIAAPFKDKELVALRLSLNGDGSLLAVGTREGPILLFDVDRRDETVTLQPAGRLIGHTRYINALAFHPSERRLVSSAKDQGIKVWDLESRTDVATLHGHLSCATCLVFNATGEQLVSGSGGALGRDNVVRLWGTRRTPEGDAASATAMRAYEEARRHLRTGVDLAQAIETMKNDPTLPEDVRMFAAEELPTRLKTLELDAAPH